MANEKSTLKLSLRLIQKSTTFTLQTTKDLLVNLKLIKGMPLLTKIRIVEPFGFDFHLVLKVKCLSLQYKSLNSKVCYNLQEFDCNTTDLFVNDFTTEDTVEQHILECRP